VAYSERDCPLFEGLSKTEYLYALDFFSARKRSYRKGEYIKKAGDSLGFFGFVLEGSAIAYLDDVDGQRMVMSNITSGNTFGEALSFFAEDSPVYICAASDCTVLELSPGRVSALSGSSNLLLDEKLSHRYESMLARRVLKMNWRIQILSRCGIREKLIAFFTFCSPDADGWITISMNRDDMAAYLGVNRSALSRELSKMRSEGILEFNKNRFRVK